MITDNNLVMMANHRSENDQITDNYNQYNLHQLKSEVTVLDLIVAKQFGDEPLDSFDFYVALSDCVERLKNKCIQLDDNIDRIEFLCD